MTNKIRVLVIDDEAPLEEIYTKFLSKIGAEVIFFDHPQKGWQAIDKEKFDLIITDLKMPAITGDEFITIIRNSKLNALTPIILSSAFINKLVITEASRESKVYFLTKPFDSKTLFELVNKAIGQQVKTTIENTSQNTKWMNSFTQKLSALTGDPAKIERMDSFDLWNFESISLTIFAQENTGPLSINLLMKTKTFLKLAGSMHGTQYNVIEAENLSEWQQFLKSTCTGVVRMSCSKILSQNILPMPGQSPIFYKVTSAHEEILICLN